MTLEDDAKTVLDWIDSDIAARGGTGRRASRIEIGLGWYDLESDLVGKPTRLGLAIRRLVETGQARLDSPEGFPMLVYVVPVNHG